MITAGVYQVNYRGASLRECWRIAGPRLFYVALLWKLLGKQGHCVWLPPSQCAIPCAVEALTEEARAHLAPVVAEMERLGYARGMFKRDARSLNPNARDAGGYQALHDDGRRVLSAAYVHIAHETPAAAVVLKTVCLSGLLLTEDLLGTIVLDHKYYLDSGLWSRVVRLRPVGVEGISKRLEREMQASRKPARRFAALNELRSVLDERNDKWHARLVQRGFYRKVSAEEEQRVLAQLGAESDEWHRGAGV